MRRELSTPQREAITRLIELGLAPCVVASDGRVMPIKPYERTRKPWVEPTLTELVPK